MSFTFLLRNQFKFRTTSSDFDAVLQSIAEARINITAYNIKQCKNRVRVLLIVGLPDSLEKDIEWNQQVKAILRRNHICYTTREVVQVGGVPAGISGVLYRIYNALYRKVQIYYIYLGENTRRIIDSNDNAEVIRILSEL